MPPMIQELQIPTGNIAGLMQFLTQQIAGVNRLIELGCEHGTGSTLAFRQGFEKYSCKNCLADTSDPAKGNTQCWITVDIVDGINPALRPGYDWWTMLVGSSDGHEIVAAASSILNGLQADMIFIDTTHTQEHMVKELQLWNRLVSPQGKWVFHDTYMEGQLNPMVDVIKAFAERDPLQRWAYVEVTQQWNGLAMLVPRSHIPSGIVEQNGGSDGGQGQQTATGRREEMEEQLQDHPLEIIEPEIC